jgi:hypothetical protein
MDGFSRVSPSLDGWFHREEDPAFGSSCSTCLATVRSTIGGMMVEVGNQPLRAHSRESRAPELSKAEKNLSRGEGEINYATLPPRHRCL